MLFGRPGSGLYKLVLLTLSCLKQNQLSGPSTPIRCCTIENASIDCRFHAFQVTTITPNGNSIIISKFVNKRVQQFLLSANLFVNPTVMEAFDRAKLQPLYALNSMGDGMRAQNLFIDSCS